MRWIAAAAMLAAFAHAQAEEEVILYPGEEAVIHFQFSEPPESDAGPVNFLALRIGGSYVDFLGQSQLEQRVIDGDQPLVERVVLRENGMSALFVSEDAPWSGEVMDFETIEDGSIEGRVVVRPVFDEGSDQSRIRFSGQLVTGTATGEGEFEPGPAAEITGCFVDAPVFGDRFEVVPQLPRSLPEPEPRECTFGI